MEQVPDSQAVPIVKDRPSLGAAGSVVLACAIATLMIALAQRLPCTQSDRNAQGQLQLAWSGDRQYVDYCYSDIIALYSADRLDQPGAFPYRTSWVDATDASDPQPQYVEYPVLTGMFMWAGARVAQGYEDLARAGALPVRLPVTVYFYVVAVGLAWAWLFVVHAVWRLSVRRPQRALLVALSPLVIAQLFTNFDAFAVAFATGAMLAWSHRRPVLAGVLIGLGTATKFYPLLLLVPALVLCLRTGKLRQGLQAVAGAAVSWVAVNAPIAILYPAGWSYFFRFSAIRGAGFESLYNIVAYVTGWAGLDANLPPGHAPTVLNSVSAALFACACVAICGIALTCPRRPRFASLCLLVLVAFLLINKVYSPQYSLWLVPVAVLALPRWRLLVPWMVLDALIWVPTLLFERGAAHGGIGEQPFLAAVLVRDAALLVLCAAVLRDIYRPARDVVRRDGDDDPCGGVFDGAADYVTLGRRRLASNDPGRRSLIV